jgi:KaiC/GvpD/RAD55 family RecA-like ATPase
MREIQRIKTGIDGLDEMLNSGIPKGHIVTLTGPTGGGKTTVALQFTLSCLQQDLSCIYITTSQSPEYLIQMGNMFGWDFEKYMQSNQLEFKFILPVKIASTPTRRDLSYSRHINGIPYTIEVTSDYLARLPAALMESSVDVIVIDSITEFLLLCADEVERRGRVIHIMNIMKEKDSTGFIVKEESKEFSSVELLSDGVIKLERLVLTEKGESVNVMRIVKMRLTDHSKDIREYKITSEGIKIFSKFGII